MEEKSSLRSVKKQEKQRFLYKRKYSHLYLTVTEDVSKKQPQNIDGFKKPTWWGMCIYKNPSKLKPCKLESKEHDQNKYIANGYLLFMLSSYVQKNSSVLAGEVSIK